MFPAFTVAGPTARRAELRFVIGAGAALDAAQDDNAFAGADFDNVVSELERETAPPRPGRIRLLAPGGG
jgi:hypothetical protein